MLVTLILTSTLALADDPWLTLDGPGGLRWGTSEQPLDAVPRPRDIYLPDSGYIGRNTKDRPDDLEVPAPQGERRFLRYVDGRLVDAWWFKQGALPVSDFARLGNVEWEGALLGPTLTSNEAGWRAFGEATSWQVTGRSALYWKDRMSNLEILASRQAPSGSYAITRAQSLRPGIPSKVKPKIKGDMNRWVQPMTAEISGCFDNSPKPVEAVVKMRWDEKGHPGRIMATADQPAVELTECVAGAISDAPALPNQEGSFSLLRLH